MTARRFVPLGVLAVAALSVPLWIDAPFVMQLLVRAALFAVVGVAWNVIGGYAGQLSLGHAAYFGCGAYTFALLPARFGIGMWLALALGSVVACMAALVIGSVTFRLRGPYFVLATIATAEILRLLALNSELTHGAIGLLAPSLFANPGVDSKFYGAAVVLLLASLVFAGWVHGSRFGYSLRAVRENEDTAMAVGIDPARCKLLALLASALLTGLAGGLYASFSQFVGPESVFSIDVSVQAALIAVLGGVGTVWGPLLGSLVLTLSSELFKAFFREAHLLVYGLLLVTVVLFLPGGVASLMPRLRRAIGRERPSSERSSASRVSPKDDRP
ncbi:MAG: branched-chain amino acid ABC transporter permease [Myxococcota bacterium]|nr:branched-chain amino acid ABC transporter permease [Myxococcota bacterium]